MHPPTPYRPSLTIIHCSPLPSSGIHFISNNCKIPVVKGEVGLILKVHAREGKFIERRWRPKPGVWPRKLNAIPCVSQDIFKTDKNAVISCLFYPSLVLSVRYSVYGKKGKTETPSMEVTSRGRDVQPGSQVLSPTLRKTLVGFGHVSPRIWEITNNRFAGGADKCEICLCRA